MEVFNVIREIAALEVRSSLLEKCSFRASVPRSVDISTQQTKKSP